MEQEFKLVDRYFKVLSYSQIHQADLKTFTALKTFGMSTITALTSQNTLGVNGVHAVPVDFISSQVRQKPRPCIC